MTAYKKTMREALQEVSSFKVKKEEKENQSFIGPEPLPDFDDEGEEVNTTPHEVELDEAKIAKKVPAKDGGYFVVLHRDTKGMRGTQDKFLMRILNKGKVKELGSHPSLDGALKFAKNQGIIEEVELDESVIDKVKKIASEKQAMKIDGVLVDMFTASAISQIYDKVNDANKKRMENLPITKLANLAFKMMQKNEFVPEETELDEDGHADVASAIRQCKTVMEDAQQIMAKLQTMSPEDSLPTWWTNKFAVASNSMNKMRDYIVNPLGEALDKEDEPTVKKVVKMLKKASGAHAGQAKDLEKAIDEDSVEIRKEKN
jgi:hypothetical protein